jgi:hypothetical protein
MVSTAWLLLLLLLLLLQLLLLLLLLQLLLLLLHHVAASMSSSCRDHVASPFTFSILQQACTGHAEAHRPKC